MVTEMAALPRLMADTVPFTSTVATLFLLVFHFGMLREVEVQVSFVVSPQDRVTEVLLNVTMGDLTQILHVIFVSSQHTVTVVIPGFFAKIFPVELMVAIEERLERNVTGCPFEEDASSLA